MEKIDEAELKKIWDMVFNLALGFLHGVEEAEEATQEILLKANAAIGSFRGESALGTWVYRIAYNYLVDERRAGFRDEISFEMFEGDVNHFSPFTNEIGLSDTEMAVYVEEIKVGCTKAMLQCLDPADRFAFILGNIFDFSGEEGARICGLSEAAYRQRLSRASRKIANFMSLNCGLVNPDATCHCRKRIGVALERGRINPDMLLHHAESRKIRDYLSAMNDLDSVAAIFRDNPYIEKADFYSEEIRRMVEGLAAGSA